MASDLKATREVIGLCGSYLTLREDAVYFVHHSAKQFLSASAFEAVFPAGTEGAHYSIFLRSLNVLSRTLRRDIDSLNVLRYTIEKVKQPDTDPLAASRSCIY